MLVVDSHCDSIEALEQGGGRLCNAYNMSARHTQFIALFTDRPGLAPAECWQMLGRERALLATEIKKDPGLRLCRTKGDILAAGKAGQKALLFSMEGASALEGCEERLDELQAEGLRCLSLTWNQNNRYGCAQPFNGTPQDTGLTAEGKELVRACNARHILLDVSHASDQTCLDILQMSAEPVLATHSNFRAVCAHNRNLTDEQARRIAAGGGVIGFNLCPPFLAKENVTMESLLPQVEYGLALVGEKALGFGFDIDGIEAYPGGLDMTRSIHDQMIEMLLRHYAEATVRRIAGENYLELFARMWS